MRVNENLLWKSYPLLLWKLTNRSFRSVTLVWFFSYFHQKAKGWQWAGCCVLLLGKGPQLWVASICGQWPPVWSVSALCNLTWDLTLSSTVWFSLASGLPFGGASTSVSVYSKFVLSISICHSCHLSRNALAAKFPCGQSEFLRPGSLPSSRGPCLPQLCNGSIYLLPPLFSIPLKWRELD